MARALIGLLLAIAIALTTGPSEACSCGVPPPRVISPGRGRDAPINTKVRVTLPRHTAAGASLELRSVDTSQLVRVREARTTMGALDLVELTPEDPLAPRTRYKVVLVRTKQRPRNLVFGSFRTTAEEDRTAPTLSRLGAARGHYNPRAIGSMCQTRDSWAEVREPKASDPGRPNAALVFGVWLADGAGRVDAKKPPTAILTTIDDGPDAVLRIGNAHLCDPLKFPFPARQSATLGIAALDEAGNASAVRVVQVRFPGIPRPPP